MTIPGLMLMFNKEAQQNKDRPPRRYSEQKGHGRKIHNRMLYYKQEFEQRRTGAIIAMSPLCYPLNFFEKFFEKFSDLM